MYFSPWCTSSCASSPFPLALLCFSALIHIFTSVYRAVVTPIYDFDFLLWSFFPISRRMIIFLGDGRPVFWPLKMMTNHWAIKRVILQASCSKSPRAVFFFVFFGRCNKAHSWRWCEQWLVLVDVNAGVHQVSCVVFGAIICARPLLLLLVFFLYFVMCLNATVGLWWNPSPFATVFLPPPPLFFAVYARPWSMACNDTTTVLSSTTARMS